MSEHIVAAALSTRAVAIWQLEKILLLCVQDKQINNISLQDVKKKKTSKRAVIEDDEDDFVAEKEEEKHESESSSGKTFTEIFIRF